MKTTDFANHLTTFLTDYLPSQRNVSSNTIKSYRDVFVLFLRYCRDVRGWVPERLCLDKIDAPVILEFLEFIKQERKCSLATQNHRLAALRSFFRYVQTEAPECLLRCQRILGIRAYRTQHPEIHYLTPEELRFILSQPNQSTPSGRRDVVLLSLLYDSGARVQELINLRPEDIRLDAPAFVRLRGKGGKRRIVPIMSNTLELLKAYLKERRLLNPDNTDRPVFTNRRGTKLSRYGVRYILCKYIKKATEAHLRLNCRVSPHTLRHTKAMHLLEANTPLPIIRDFLGHVDIGTTGIYARANLEMKRKALEKAEDLSPHPSHTSSIWRDDKKLIEWLQAL